MAATKEQKERFIELRAQGLSFDKISKDINVSKPTLISWQRELQREISNLEYFNCQSLLEQYQLTKRHRIETLAKSLENVLKEIDKRELKEVSLKDLINIKDNLEVQLGKEINSIRYFTGERTDFVLEKLLEGDEVTVPLD